jgi:hypothetical protein
MKKTLLLSLLLTALVVLPARADFVLNGKTYPADTLVRRQVGPGMMNTIVRIPGIPLNIYVVEVDLNDPNNRVETTYGNSQLGHTELLTNAVKRHRTPTKRPLVACNANFWVTNGSYPWCHFESGTPQGGVVCNDTTIVNDNNTQDVWAGGPWNSGTAAITHDKQIVMGRLKWTGLIHSDKFAQPVEFHNVNRRAVTGEICLYGPPFGRDRKFENNWSSFNTWGKNYSDNYYLTFVEGYTWNTNQPMKFTVASIVKGLDKQTLGAYDACLTVTGDATKELMSALEEGDEIELTSSWYPLDADAAVIPTSSIENLVTGNAIIMHNGVLTGRNTEDGYNTPNYSRTCYGTSADGKHLYLLVIDKSASPLYGLSLGCPTADACEILRQMCPDVNEMVNMDAGGSAEMLVRGTIINTTTETTPRGVSCGWMVEAIGEEDNEIASIAFDQFRLDIPQFASTTPKILGYNRIGELVDEDVQGFTLTCTEEVGTADGDVFTASNEEAWGSITATFNGMTATAPVHVMPADPYLLLSPILIDEREYPIEVVAKMVNKIYYYDPANVNWRIDKEGVVDIENGVVHGLANGTTKIFCDMGPYSISGRVNVEISDTPYRYEGWDGWTLRGTGTKDLVLDEATGKMTFTYANNRAPNIKMTKNATLYGLPDTIGFVFNSTMPIDYVQIDTRNFFYTKTNYVMFEPEEGQEYFEPGVDHLLLLNMKELGGPDYAGAYPITIKAIKFTLTKTAEEKDYEIDLKSLYCHYRGFDEPQPYVSGDVNTDGEINIADVNALISHILMGEGIISSYDVNGDGEINIADVNAVIDIILGN